VCNKSVLVHSNIYVVHILHGKKMNEHGLTFMVIYLLSSIHYRY
jgi:hypothetical protein